MRRGEWRLNVVVVLVVVTIGVCFVPMVYLISPSAC